MLRRRDWSREETDGLETVRIGDAEVDFRSFDLKSHGSTTRLTLLEAMLLKHLEGILNYCRTKVPMGVVEAVNGNIKALLRRGRGYADLNYLLLKAQRLAATKTEFVVSRKAA